MGLSKYEWLFIATALVWAFGGVWAFVTALAKRKVSKEVRHANWDPLLLTALLCGVMAYLYHMMATGFKPYQRTDGREIIWFRDAGLAIITAVNMIITATVVRVDSIEGWGVVVVTFIGALALFAGNNIAYPHTHAAFWVGAAVVAVMCLWLFIRMQSKTWMSRIVLALQAGCTVGLALVQLLSWTMFQVLDDAPHRFVSECVYAAVTLFVVAAIGVTGSIAFQEHHHPTPPAHAHPN